MFNNSSFSYDTVSWIDASFYDDFSLIVEAARLAGGNDKDSILDGLTKIKGYDGIMTSYSYHEDHSYAGYIYLAVVQEDGTIEVSDAVEVTH